MGDLAQPPQAVRNLVPNVCPWQKQGGAESAEPMVAEDEDVSGGEPVIAIALAAGPRCASAGRGGFPVGVVLSCRSSRV